MAAQSIASNVIDLKDQREQRVLDRVSRSPELALVLVILKALPPEVAWNAAKVLDKTRKASPGDAVIEEAAVLFSKTTGLTV